MIEVSSAAVSVTVAADWDKGVLIGRRRGEEGKEEAQEGKRTRGSLESGWVLSVHSKEVCEKAPKGCSSS